MAIKQIALAVTGLVGLAAVASMPLSNANAQAQSIPDMTRGTSAAKDGVVMIQDAANVYVYDAGNKKLITYSKTPTLGGIAETWVIDIPSMKGSLVKAK